MTKEEKTFLDVVAYAEGTLGVSNNGYDVLINDNPSAGSRIINGWTTDTKIQHGLNTWKVKVGAVESTAAGRYQFTKNSWLSWNNNDNAPLTKVNQDTAALKYLRYLIGSTYDFKVTSTEDMQKVANLIKDVWSSFSTAATTLKSDKKSVKTADKLFGIYKDALRLY